MKYLKLYLLFIFVILFSPKVFASTDVNINSTIKFPYNGSNGTYQGLEIYNSGGAFTYNLGTRYNGKLSTINFYSSYSFDTNTTYIITLNMATNDWRNSFMGPQVFRANSDGSIPSTASNWASNSSITFVSRQKIKFNFTTGDTLGPLTKFTIYSTNANETPFTGESNWNLSSVILTIPSGSSGGGGSGGSSSDSTNQDIINNNSQNTQDIINNNNNNTQDILNSLSDSTYPVCGNGNRYFVIGSDKSYIASSNGRINSNTGYYVSSPVKIASNTSYTLNIVDATGIQYGYYCFYDKDNNPISCTRYTDNDTINYTFTSPQNSVYFRATLRRSSNVITNAYLTGPICITSSYETTYNSQVSNFKQDAINGYLTDDSDPTVDGSALNNVFGTVHFSDPLSYLLTLPTQLINKIVSMSDTCSPIDLGSLYGVHLTLPCINLQSYLGVDLWNILDVILSVGLLSVILKNFYDTISNLLTLGGEKEAKEKFSMPTPMDFLAMILGGDNR